MAPFTDKTPTDYPALLKRVQKTRGQGFVFYQGFCDPGGSIVAVPVRDSTGQVVACVNISGPDSGFDFDKIDSFYIPKTKATALNISRELGYAGPA